MSYTPPNGYRDRFNILNNYQKLLFIEGNGLQSSELNELQDAIRNDLSLISNFLVANGTLISGGTVSSLASNTISLTQTGVLINGHVVQVPANTVSISGVGIEIIGIAYITNLVSYLTDPSLVELDTQSPIVGQPTSFREQANGRWCLSSQILTGEIFFPVYTLNNGQIVSTNTPGDDEVNDVLTQYDLETRGSAVLNGLKVSYNSTDPSSGSVIMNVSSGLARVQGVRIKAPYQQTCSLSPINDTQNILSDFYTYILPPTSITSSTSTSGGFLPAATYSYKVTSSTGTAESQASTAISVTTTGTTSTISLSWTSIPGATQYNIYGRTASDNFSFITSVTTNSWTDTGTVNKNSAITAPISYTTPAHYFPVSGILQITGNKMATVSVNKGIPGGTDILPAPAGYSNALSVVSIVSVSYAGTTYSPTTDYALSGAYSISWAKNGSAPPQNVSYSVTYIYNAVISPTTSTQFLSSDLTQFVLDSSNVYVNNSTISISYAFYLKRIDRVSIDSFGNFSINKGTPGYLTTSIYAPVKATSALSLATILLTYNQTPIVTTDTTLNLLVTDWDNVQSQLAALQTQVAALTLTSNAISTIAPTSAKRGIFVDSFNNTNNQDASQTNTAVLYPDKSSGVGTYSLGIGHNLQYLGVTTSVTVLPYTEISFGLYNHSLTGYRQINPFGTPTITYNPHINQSTSCLYANTTEWYFTGQYLPNSMSISIRLQGFMPGENITVAFGAPSSFTNNNTSLSTAPIAYASGVCDNTGALTIYNFNIPAGTPVGSYLMQARGSSSGVGAVCSMNIYPSPIGVDGTQDLTQYNTWTGPNSITYGFDTVAQSFTSGSIYDATSVNVYFGSPPTSDVYVRVVNLAYGQPDTTAVCGQGSLPVTQLVSGKNKIPFTSPVRAIPYKIYALTVATANNTGTIGTAVAGKADLLTGASTTSNPFTQGNLLTSTNFNSWTSIPNEDMWFDFNRANYTVNTPTTVSLITTAPVTSYTDWMLSGAVDIPTSTTCSFYLQDSFGNQYPITPNVALFTQPISGIVTLYAVLNSTFNQLSPQIPKGVQLYGYQASLPAVYTSVVIPVSNGVSNPANLTLVFDAYNPLQTGITPQVLLADGVSYGNMTFVSSNPYGNGWSEVTFSYTGLASNITRLRFQITTSNTAIRPKLTNARMIVV